MKISVIIPVFNSADLIAACQAAVAGVLDHLPDASEIIYVDDGSRDNSLEVLRRLQTKDSRIRIIELEHIATVWTMPGISTERMDYYLAPFSQGDRIGKGGGVAGENEDIIVEEHSLADLWSSAKRGKLSDLKTLTLLFALKDRHPELFD